MAALDAVEDGLLEKQKEGEGKEKEAALPMVNGMASVHTLWARDVDQPGASSSSFFPSDTTCGLLDSRGPGFPRPVPFPRPRSRTSRQ